MRRDTTIRRIGTALALAVALSCAALAAPVRFAVLTDLHAHDLDSPLEGKWMSHTAERIGLFVDSAHAAAVDFVIELGDFVNGWVVLGVDPGSPDRIPAILAWADGLLAEFDGPRYHVIGNHDLYNLDKTQYRTALGMAATTYSFDAGGVHFIAIDVQFDEAGTDLAHTYTGVAGFLPESNLAWLRRDLATSDCPTVVFVHQRLDSFVEEWNRPLIANAEEIRALLAADGDVVLVLQGHAHTNDLSILGGIPYVTLEALVDQDTPPSWAIVVIDSEMRSIEIRGEGEQQDYDFGF